MSSRCPRCSSSNPFPAGHLTLSSPPPSPAALVSLVLNRHPHLDFCLSCFKLICQHLTQAVEQTRAGALDPRLREPGFKSCAALIYPGQLFFTLRCYGSLGCMNAYLAIDSGGYLHTNSLCALFAV